MIGKLSGRIDSFDDGSLILDAGGVGYLVFASRRTLGRCGSPGEAVALRIETNVREDYIHLYGFIDAEEQRWFRLLTGVQGVGAKAALSILSVCEPSELALSIGAQDKALLTKADGVGPKLATRIVTELKDKAGVSEFYQSIVKSSASVAAPEQAGSSVDQDAVLALIGLGYGRAEAFSAVMQARGKANDNDQKDLQHLIKLSLQELSHE